ncbi:hypothetical protein [Yinghuangia seranimata]|uniref:hypothetical protein n=1 Tax=Yinghuangia seranimata TaxID=408067 RepID=UPI00248B6A94|nr:hypothetical protein [Yinghuangia seranimata]MDI2129762.1 hypothetical protein [Yinghuangia seranimata]
MGLFRRGPKRDPRDAPRDPAFEFMSFEEGRRLRALTRESFAECGLEVSVYADHMTDASGRHYNLYNLAAGCHNDERGPRAWPILIQDHVQKLVRAMDSPALATMPADELWARLYPRITADDSLPDDPAFAYAPVPAPGLREVLGLDLPESVQTLPADALAELGDLPSLRLRAMNNLRALPIEDHDVVKHTDGANFHLIAGDSFFTASRALVLDDLVPRVTGQPLGPDGALVALPFRHLLAFHPITGMDVVPSLTAMAAFAAYRHDEAPGPVSPYAYWWRRGRLVQLSERSPDGLAIVVDQEFSALLERLLGEE